MLTLTVIECKDIHFDRKPPNIITELNSCMIFWWGFLAFTKGSRMHQLSHNLNTFISNNCLYECNTLKKTWWYNNQTVVSTVLCRKTFCWCAEYKVNADFLGNQETDKLGMLSLNYRVSHCTLEGPGDVRCVRWDSVLCRIWGKGDQWDLGSKVLSLLWSQENQIHNNSNRGEKQRAPITDPQNIWENLLCPRGETDNMPVT